MFICKVHGKYNSTINNNGCPKCNSSDKNIELEKNNFISKAKKIHKNKYKYDDFIFKDFTTPGIIKCKKHGAFEISLAVHILHRMGCPKCYKSISKGETEWLDYLGIKERNNILEIGDYSFRPDGIDRERKIVFEYLGSYWHGNPKIYNQNEINYDTKKTFGQLYKETLERENIIKNAGYKVISIWDIDWEKIKKRLKIK